MTTTNRWIIAKYGLLTTLFCLSFICPAQDIKRDITNVIVKENLIKNNKLAIIACDSNDTPLEHVNGTYSFVINGFKQSLVFHDGVAISPQEIDKSLFVLLKHENTHGAFSKLYYVYKGADSLKPIKISWMFLLLIPVVLIIIASLYKRLLIIAVIALIALGYFGYSKGLELWSVLETIFQGLKNFIN
ncbi:hypothetical protein [Olivibacter sitiensis]|uniref:hypothetical protein n=1 Tax=Olivibacter sitiensis TaxID=376470 RepID=UPI001FE166D2|nr:hypothetical protein [Olivibacter sitiensis]